MLELGFVAFLYYLGRERNLCTFQFRGSNSDVVVHGILEGIQSCLCSWKAVKSSSKSVEDSRSLEPCSCCSCLFWFCKCRFWCFVSFGHVFWLCVCTVARLFPCSLFLVGYNIRLSKKKKIPSFSR